MGVPVSPCSQLPARRGRDLFNSRFAVVPDWHVCPNSSSIAGLAPSGYAIALNLLSRLGETANIVSRRRNTGGCSGESSMRHQLSHPWVDQEAPRPSAIGPLGDPDQREPATATHRSGPHDQASGSNATAPLGAHSVHLIAVGTSQALDRPTCWVDRGPLFYARNQQRLPLQHAVREAADGPQVGLSGESGGNVVPSGVPQLLGEGEPPG